MVGKKEATLTDTISISKFITITDRKVKDDKLSFILELDDMSIIESSLLENILTRKIAPKVKSGTLDIKLLQDNKTVRLSDLTKISIDTRRQQAIKIICVLHENAVDTDAIEASLKKHNLDSYIELIDVVMSELDKQD